MRNQNAAKKARRCDTCCGNTAPKMRCPSPHARDLPRDREILQSSSRTRTDADLVICEVSLSSFCLPDHSREMTIQGKRHSRIFLLPLEGGAPKGRRLAHAIVKDDEICLPSYRHPERSRGIFFVSLFLRNAVCMKHRDPTSQRVRCFPLSAVLTFPDRSRMKKDFSLSLENDDTGGAASSKMTIQGCSILVSCI